MRKNILVFVVLAFLLISSVSYAFESISEEEIRDIVQQVDLNSLPAVVKFILGKPKINIEVSDNEITETYGFIIVNNEVVDFNVGGIENPNYLIKVNYDVMEDIVNADNPMVKVEEYYLSKDMVIEPQTLGSKILFGIAKLFI